MKSNIVEQVTKEIEQVQGRDYDNGFRGVPMLAHDRVASAALLSNPKGKLSRGARKALMLARSFRVVPNVPLVPRAPAVRFALKLRELTMHQLGRRLAQFARKAATARYILADLAEFSAFRSRVASTQDGHLAAFRQVEAEIKARNLACLGQLAPAAE